MSLFPPTPLFFIPFIFSLIHIRLPTSCIFFALLLSASILFVPVSFTVSIRYTFCLIPILLSFRHCFFFYFSFRHSTFFTLFYFPVYLLFIILLFLHHSTFFFSSIYFFPTFFSSFCFLFYFLYVI